MSDKTLEQQRAKHAWDAIIGLRIPNADPPYGEETETYAREAKKLPVRIRNAGLGQALAFLKAKEKKKHGLKKLLNDLTGWVVGQRGIGKPPQDLLDNYLEGDADLLRRATDETLAYLVWLNRFADAEGIMTDEAEGGD